MEKYIWATWTIGANKNVMNYFNPNDGEAIYIHAFTSDADEDGEGFHLYTEGALLTFSPTDKHCTRVILAVPDDGYARRKRAVFSPSELAGRNADQWGVGTLEEIAKAVAAL